MKATRECEKGLREREGGREGGRKRERGSVMTTVGKTTRLLSLPDQPLGAEL